MPRHAVAVAARVAMEDQTRDKVRMLYVFFLNPVSFYCEKNENKRKLERHNGFFNLLIKI